MCGGGGGEWEWERDFTIGFSPVFSLNKVLGIFTKKKMYSKGSNIIFTKLCPFMNCPLLCIM